MTMTAKAASTALKKLANRADAPILARFFQCGKGGYAEGDLFLGVKVPNTRSVAKRFKDLPLHECLALLKSKFHEERLLALLILGFQFNKADEGHQKKIHSLFMKNLRYVNNWDLVDSSAPVIAGAYLREKDRSPLYKLARSKDLWKKRVAIIATFDFIRQHDFADTLAMAEILMRDEHDLIHKAVGWMIREVGNRDLKTEEAFLLKHYKKMPRTMLRYAIEKFPEDRRQLYLKGKI